MINQNYSNVDLARDYYKYQLVYARDGSDVARYGKIKNLIEGLGTDIPRLYAKEGSLKSLKILGISQSTKLSLEVILAKGIDEALRLAREKKDKALQTAPIEDSRKKYKRAKQEGVRKFFSR